MSPRRRTAVLAALVAPVACNALLGNEERPLGVDAGSDASATPDVGSAADARADTAVVPDTGVAPDSGDAAVAADASVAPDAAPGPDGGSASEGGGVLDGAADAQPDVAPTRSFLSPMTGPSGATGFARDTDRTIASEDPATIYYTTDGGVPDLSSPHGPSPLTMTFPDGSTLRWFSFNGAQESVQAAPIQSDPSQQGKFDWLVEDVTLDGVSPVVVAQPLAQLAGTAKYQIWDPGSEGVQLTYGIGPATKAAGCIVQGKASPYPGVSGTAALALTAPSQPGLYTVRADYFAQADCAGAMAIGLSSSSTVIGVLVVR